jgi:hypothetical protein
VEVALGQHATIMSLIDQKSTLIFAMRIQELARMVIDREILHFDRWSLVGWCEEMNTPDSLLDDMNVTIVVKVKYRGSGITLERSQKA